MNKNHLQCTSSVHKLGGLVYLWPRCAQTDCPASYMAPQEASFATEDDITLVEDPGDESDREDEADSPSPPPDVKLSGGGKAPSRGFGHGITCIHI